MAPGNAGQESWCKSHEFCKCSASGLPRMFPSGPHRDLYPETLLLLFCRLLLHKPKANPCMNRVAMYFSILFPAWVSIILILNPGPYTSPYSPKEIRDISTQKKLTGVLNRQQGNIIGT